MTERVNRRTACKLTGALALALVDVRWVAAQRSVAMPGHGYGHDPDLLNREVTWARTLDRQHLAMLRTICDIVLPSEPPHRSAGDIGVHEFIDEWVSAPYALMKRDRVLIVAGLEALNEDVRARHAVLFSEADPAQRTGSFDRACSAAASIGFARRLIELICAGYYTTREGHAAIGYTGNVALSSFPEPPVEAVRHLERKLTELSA